MMGENVNRNDIPFLKKLAYKMYKDDWINSHIGIGSYRWNRAHEEYAQECFEYGEDQTFDQWAEETGFGYGSCYVCFSEFLQAEYLDVSYMKELLPEKLFDIYWEDQQETKKAMREKLGQEPSIRHITGELTNIFSKVPHKSLEQFEQGVFVTRKDSDEVIYLGNSEDGYWGWIFEAPEIMNENPTEEVLKTALPDAFNNGNYDTEGFSVAFCDSLEDLVSCLGIQFDMDEMKSLKNYFDPDRCELENIRTWDGKEADGIITEEAIINEDPIPEDELDGYQKEQTKNVCKDR